MSPGFTTVPVRPEEVIVELPGTPVSGMAKPVLSENVCVVPGTSPGRGLPVSDCIPDPAQTGEVKVAKLATGFT